jgi:hypothetical protein
MALMHRQFLALLLIISFSLSGVAFADSPAEGSSGRTVYGDPDVAHHLNSFAMIFGRCVWIPPSPKAALAAFSLFFGVDTRTEPDIAAAEATIASQYIVAGKTQTEADKEVAWLNACFATYEVPPENRNHAAKAGLEHQTATGMEGKR